MQPTSERIDRIARKARERGVHLGPPLTEEALSQIETRCACPLPDGFRAFVVGVGNGSGKGPPEYGLLALGEIPDDMSTEESRPWREPDGLRRPFPFTKTWVWEEGEPSDEGTQEQVADGTLHLGTDGCGQYWLLIVNGPERGNVWMLTDVGITPADPNVDFLQWFEDWLDGIGV